MSTTFTLNLGDRGRLVVPAELRERQSWVQGTPLLMIETDRGVVLTTQDQAKSLVREQLVGSSLVEALLADRREAAAVEDAE